MILNFRTGRPRAWNADFCCGGDRRGANELASYPPTRAAVAVSAETRRPAGSIRFLRVRARAPASVGKKE